MCWWCVGGVLVMCWWCVSVGVHSCSNITWCDEQQGLSSHGDWCVECWWCVGGVLVMCWWCVGDVLVMYWWCWCWCNMRVAFDKARSSNLFTVNRRILTSLHASLLHIIHHTLHFWTTTGMSEAPDYFDFPTSCSFISFIVLLVSPALWFLYCMLRCWAEIAVHSLDVY
jgi:hypothetical protein